MKTPEITQLAQKYPWPAQKPEVPEDLHGWCDISHRKMFEQILHPKMSVILELGSWLGKSTRLLSSMAPQAVVICIDHWLGSQEHHENEAYCQKLPTLYETFIVNLWEERERVIPVRLTTVAALEEIRQHQIVPDLIYIDAGHAYQDVHADISTSLRLFPMSVICGDDWSWEDVRRAVTEIAGEHNKSIALSDQQCWRYER
ncbi:MAG: class I SAM-dependent methyltransferase [Planctomycetaceae bacterium]|nr:class I SAM-dependent methyltransferase [Planctomycetaceae bacterium]